MSTIVGSNKERSNKDKERRNKEGSQKKDKGKEVMTEEKERTARRRSSGVHIEETRPGVLPSVHIRNQAGQREEVIQTVFPGTMPSTGKPSTNKASAQAKPVEVEIVTEAKVMEAAKSNTYHDEAFLSLLGGLK